MNGLRTTLVALLAAAILPFAVSCSRPDAAARDQGAGVEKKTDKGPVSVVIRVDKAEITVVDKLNLSIEATAESGYEVVLPPVGDKLDEFAILDFRTDPPALGAKGMTIWRRSYVLEPFLSGEYRIAPMTLNFRKKDGADGKTYEIFTEGLTIRVKSLLPEQVANLKIHDIASPVELPRSSTPRIVAIAVLVVIILAVIGYLLARRYLFRVRGPIITPPRPDEIAFRALEALVAEDLVSKGEFKLFYQRISDILRHYIENRFSIHAPEQTTEEFLQTLGANGALSRRYRNLLQEFLVHCDLVKFAMHRPESPEIQKTFDSCRKFIEETAERIELMPAIPADNPVSGEGGGK